MSVEVECDGFKIEFKEVVNAFIFDEKDKKKTNTYHGMSHESGRYRRRTSRLSFFY
jgi:hypothetical protein